VAALSLVDLARTLIDLDSTTGREAEACAWLAGYLRQRGFRVTEQPVSGERANVLALVEAKPTVILSTHIDCVPPFFPSRVEAGRLHGRGACDAKGALAAEITALERLREAGEERAGLLVVVGEERGSDGAAAANRISPGPAFLVNGEPTDGKLGLATRGAFRVKLRATGKAAHSSQPERGVSAIDLLVDALVELRGIALPEAPPLGRTFYATGLISGGIAPNVISPSAEAELNFRTVGPGAEVLERLAPLRSRVAIETVLEVPPVRMRTVPGFETAAFAFTTDIPLLDRWGEPLLFGPGSVLDAHTDSDSVGIAELEAAAASYERIVRTLLAEASAGAGRALSR
jgi:acetylornithine deacetylase